MLGSSWKGTGGVARPTAHATILCPYACVAVLPVLLCNPCIGSLRSNCVYACRDGLLAEAVGKHKGPTSSVLLTRDEVLHIIDQTNKAVSARHDTGQREGTRYQDEDDEGGKVCSSSLFWDEVYKETALLEANSVLSITELSMMVFGFLKSYVQEGSAAVGLFSEGALQVSAKPTAQHVIEQAARPTTSGGSSVVSESDYTSDMVPAAISDSGTTLPQGESSYPTQRSQVAQEGWKKPEYSANSSGGTVSRVQWQQSLEQEHSQKPQAEGPRRSTSVPSSAGDSPLGSKGGLGEDFPKEIPRSSPADAASFLKAVGADAEDPCEHYRAALRGGFGFILTPRATACAVIV